MRSLLVIIYCFLSTSSIVHAQLACTKIYHAGLGQFGIFNNCDKCMIASMAWCDGSIQKFPVAANSGRTVASCLGNASLVGENPCPETSNINLNPSNIARSNLQPYILTSLTLSSSSKNINSIIAAASCSAKNDSGDTCSITCPDGQAAQCNNASGAGTPTCICKIS